MYTMKVFISETLTWVALQWHPVVAALNSMYLGTFTS